jgi:hypothetical protein
MYIMITEDWNVYKSEKITSEDKEAVENGYLDVIDITDPANPTRFNGDVWQSVDVWPYFGD